MRPGRVSLTAQSSEEAPDNSTYQLKLFSCENCHYSHWIRLVLKVKDVNVETVMLDHIRELPEEVYNLKPLNDITDLPIMLDHEYVIARPLITAHYIDERFPHPPLMLQSPLDRTGMRAKIYDIETKIVPLVDNLVLGKGTASVRENRLQQLDELLVKFSHHYFSEIDVREHEFNMIDCIMAPILWRLESLGVNSRQWNAARARYAPLLAYKKYVLSQPAVQKSCTPEELRLRA